MEYISDHNFFFSFMRSKWNLCYSNTLFLWFLHILHCCVFWPAWHSICWWKQSFLVLNIFLCYKWRKEKENMQKGERYQCLGSTLKHWQTIKTGRLLGKTFLYTHLGYSLNFTIVCHCHVMGGILLPSRGIVGKNRSSRSKTTVRSKKVGPLGSRSGPFTWFPQCYLFICFLYFP